MTFTSPLALILLLAIPYLAWLAWRPQDTTAREWVSLAVRCLIAVLLVLALAGAQAVHWTDELAIVYLVDVSDSIRQDERQAAVEWVRSAIEALGSNDRAAVVLFGTEAVVERPLSALRQLGPVTSAPQSLSTNIDSAIRLGMALLPAGAARRLVILSDGVETATRAGSSAAEGARLAAASGARIDVHPLGEVLEESEALVAAVSAPTRLTRGDRFDLTVTVESNRSISTLLRVLDGGIVVHEESVGLTKGENRFAIPLVAGEQGFARYAVQILPAADSFYQNNELGAFTEIIGPPRVLVISPPARLDADGNEIPDDSDQLVPALLAAGMIVERIDTPRLPATLATLNDHAAIVLVNVSAKQLTPRKMAMLQTYVRDLGGGMVAVGGPESYAPGGYYRTALEEILPVDMHLKDQERRANLTLYFVIDKSGSMADTSVGGIPKVELAKEAIIRSLGLLGPMDRAGVVAFDGSASWVVPANDVTDPDGMAGLVGSIRASGGTDIYAGLLAVAEAVPDDPATLKHVILLTDGGAAESGNPELTRDMHRLYGVTLSVVAIGQGYAPWIERLPALGEGRFHLAYDPDTIPEIFTQETSIATRAYIIEEPFWPTQVQRHPILDGITAVPPLYGYVGTSPKQAAQTILTTHQDDPLLAAWRYGLGKSVAWTSDATSRWSTEWVTWTGYPRFWEQLVRWTISQERGSSADIEVTADGSRAVVTVEAAGVDDAFLNGLEMDVRVVGPDGIPGTVAVQQIAPGRYQGSFEPTSEGAYLIRAVGSGEEASVAQTAGWVFGYSSEYRTTEPDHDYLAHLARLTGGKVLIEPWESLSHDVSADPIRRAIWHWLVLAALLLLPLDVALRRLVIQRKAVVEAWANLQSWVRIKAPRRPPAIVRSDGVNRLLEAKQRAGRPEPPPPEPAMPDDLPPTEPEPTPSHALPRATPDGSGLARHLLNSKKKREETTHD